MNKEKSSSEERREEKIIEINEGERALMDVMSDEGASEGGFEGASERGFEGASDEGSEEASDEPDTSTWQMTMGRRKNVPGLSRRINYEKHDINYEESEEETKSTEFEVLGSETEGVESTMEKNELASQDKGEASSEVSGYVTDEDRRFPKEEQEIFKFGKVRVMRMGYKCTKEGNIYAVVYRCRGQEIELPHIDEEGNEEELYDAPLEKKAEYIPDVKLSLEKEKTLGIPTYLSTPSNLREDQEGELREEYEIVEEYELSFPSKKTLAHEIPDGSLVVYAAQLKAGLRFPLHPLFKDVLKFWSIQLGQLTPNGVRVIIGFIILCKMYGVKVSLDIFRQYFYISQKFGSKDGRCFYYFTRKPNAVTLVDQLTSVHDWKKQFLFIKHESFRTEGLACAWNLRNKVNNTCKRYGGTDAQLKSMMILNNRHHWLDVRLNWPGMLDAAGLAGERKTDLRRLEVLGMDLLTDALKKAPKRKSSVESPVYTCKVLTAPPLSGGSYSFDGRFYYVPGQFKEPAAKKGKVDVGKAEAVSEQTKGGSEKEKGPRVKKTPLKTHGVGKKARELIKLKESREKEEASTKEKVDLTTVNDAEVEKKDKGKEKIDEEKEDKVSEMFIPKWSIKSGRAVKNAADCESYLMNSTSEIMQKAFSRIKVDRFEDEWLQSKCNAWFHDREMFRRFWNSQKRNEKDTSMKKLMKEELDSTKDACSEANKKLKMVEEELVKIKEELEKEIKEKNHWEEAFNKEQESCKQWEAAAKILKEKYEDDEGHIKKNIYEFCVSSFVHSSEYKNLHFRTNYQTAKESMQKAHKFVTDRLPEFEEEYNIYVNEEYARSYAFPWEKGFDLQRYCRKFPTPEPSEDEEEEEEENVEIAEEEVEGEEKLVEEPDATIIPEERVEDDGDNKEEELPEDAAKLPEDAATLNEK